MVDLIAPITEVTVYADRALITRQGSITLPEGEHTLAITNLPDFSRESLRAAGRGPQGTRILNVEVTTAFNVQPPETVAAALLKEIEALQQQKQLLTARQQALEDRRKWLRTLGEQSKDFARGIAQGQMKPQDCADFFSFMSIQSLQDAESAQGLELEIQQLQQELDAKERERWQQTQRFSPDRLRALVTIALPQAGSFEMEISYIVHNASWTPLYDVRVEKELDQENGEVELTYLGVVQQGTGESWENVNLSLSTARPGLAATLPELKPWYINTYTPPKPVMYAARSMAPAAVPTAAWGTSAAQSALAEEQEPAVEAEIETATTEQTATAAVFHVGHAVNIPGNNTPYKTTIAHSNLPCEFDYVSAPILEENVHLRATIKNTTDNLLLKGETSIFMNGEYVGTTQLKMTASGEVFKVFLGLEDAIKIKRELLELSVDKGNLLQNDLRRTVYAYRITVQNYARVPKRLSVRDHLPVSQHERIKVKIQTLQPQPTKRSGLELVTWKFTLAPGNEQRIEQRFQIEHPQGMSITGLPTQK